MNTFLSMLGYVPAQEFVIIILSFLIVTVIGIFITRAIFSIGTIVKKLLALIGSKGSEDVVKWVRTGLPCTIYAQL